MAELSSEHPQEYPKGTPTLAGDELSALRAEVPRWEVQDDRLVRGFKFRDFNEAFGFLTRIALLAEAEGHHPDIRNSWNQVILEFWTHTAGGLTRNDFIMAARIDAFLDN
ncbi:MAG: 4a-hydroxytetrahydrobiopterin dehydratase [Actinomycetota bacterium]